MEIDKDIIIQEFKIHAVGGKGFYTSRDFECNVCGKKNKKFAIKFIKDGGLVNCFVCGNSDSIFGWLFKIKRQDLILKDHGHNYKNKLQFVGIMQNDNYTTTESLKVVPEVLLPKGLKVLKTDAYLSKRGITPAQMQNYNVGKTESFLHKNLRGYYIFSILNGGRLVGWLARTDKDNEWHDKNRADSKLGLCSYMPRYRNNPTTEFQDVLGNIDSVTDETNMVIVVEGITDMFNLENIMPEFVDTKVVFTFGHSFSNYQRELLKRKKGVSTVILMYDGDSILHMKKVAIQLMEDFPIVFVAPLPKGKDPGNIDKIELSNSFRELKDPIEYFSKIIKI